ncbi:MAG: AAA family ATPase [Comamonadaceae bacterium]
MYAHHFGLTQDPFSIAPDPRYLFMSERHREALAHLLYGVAGSGAKSGGSGGGFVLLTGDIGTGKTTICRCFLEQIPQGCHVAYIFNPKLTVTELLQSICEEFHVTLTSASPTPPTVKDYIDALNNFLLAGHAAGQSSVLIIDEAQNLAPEVLEQLRLLTNLETSERKLLQIVLIGQPELRTMLARPELEQLAQRVIARFHLDALTMAESAQYIAHRLAVAGLTGPSPFDGNALQRIHRLARGVPRRINLLSGRALLGAWAHGQHRVDRAVVDKAAVEVFGPATAADSGKRGGAFYLALGLVLLAVAALSAALYTPTSQTRQIVARPASAAAPASGASASMPLVDASSAIVRETRLVPQPIEALDSLLAQLPLDINVAWQALGANWKLPSTDGDPCSTANQQKLQCYRAGNLSLPQLRQLNRPGILTLHVNAARPQYALLVGLGEQAATLRLADGLHRVTLVSLGRWWRGDFATYWQAPPDYQPDLRDGSSGAAIEHLARQLDLLEATPAPAPEAGARMLDRALRERVRTFQRSQGLKADGQPGPMTFMQLDSATGANPVRLQSEPR